eukprot:scaffold76039_cov72-Phaeocystis_antarctica.AAC.1
MPHAPLILSSAQKAASHLSRGAPLILVVWAYIVGRGGAVVGVGLVSETCQQSIHAEVSGSTASRWMAAEAQIGPAGEHRAPVSCSKREREVHNLCNLLKCDEGKLARKLQTSLISYRGSIGRTMRDARHASATISC